MVKARLGSVFPLAAFAGSMLAAPSVSAHVDIVDPASRYGPDDIKDAPCGHPDNPPGAAAPHEFEAGSTITVVIDEFVGHQGHLRIAWAENDEDIVTVTAFDDFDNFPGVLMDNIPDASGASVYEIDVTLPDEPCDNCTLQVIQVMYDGDGFQENDLYYSCADITLTPAGAGSAGADSGGPMGSGGDDTGDTGASDTTGGTNTSAGNTSRGNGGGDSTDGAGGSEDSGTASVGASDDDGDDDGCSCRTGTRTRPGWLWLVLIPLARRRRTAARSRDADEMTLEFAIGPTGNVGDARVDPAASIDETLTRCSVEALERWRFPKPNGGKTIRVEYPIIFEPGPGD